MAYQNQKTTKPLSTMDFIKTTILLFALFISPIAKSSNKPSNCPLFDSSELLEIVLEMDMQKILNDKSEDPQYNPAFLIQKLEDNKIQAFNIKVKAAGNTRRISKICEFPLLKLNFKKDDVENTVFEGQDKIKMVTHCRNNEDYENYATLEYLAYKTYNALTDYSYRVRLVKVLYRDISGQYPDIEKTGFLIEDDELLTKRLNADISEKRIWSPDSCNQEVVDLFSLFQFMIGNTDWWIHKRHNVDIVVLQNKELIPIPYDFDYAGIINTPYAIPSPQLPIEEVSDRFFKGKCKTIEGYQQAIDLFNERKSEILNIIDETEFLNRRFKKNATTYILSFYKIINDPKKLAKFINQSCEVLYHIPGQARINDDSLKKE